MIRMGSGVRGDKLRSSLVSFFASLFLAACSLSTGPTPANNFPATQTAKAVATLKWTGVDVPDVLARTHWKLEKLEGHDLIPGTYITLAFENKELSGNAGCNDYTTTFLNSPGNNFGTG
jgi:heat shock protein HslJ